jgi:ketosteroid isomerase-like protein
VITFESDDEATCTSYMFAQHLIRDVPEGEVFIMRGSYTNVMRRNQDGGWEIRRLTMHFTWGEGNENLHQLSQERFKQGSAA